MSGQMTIIIFSLENYLSFSLIEKLLRLVFVPDTTSAIDIIFEWYCTIRGCISRPIIYRANSNRTVQYWLFYPGGGTVVRLLCINLGSAAKRLKESDLVRDSTR